MPSRYPAIVMLAVASFRRDGLRIFPQSEAQKAPPASPPLPPAVPPARPSALLERPRRGDVPARRPAPLADLERDELIAVVRLYRALGGGWSTGVTTGVTGTARPFSAELYQLPPPSAKGCSARLAARIRRVTEVRQ